MLMMLLHQLEAETSQNQFCQLPPLWYILLLKREKVTNNLMCICFRAFLQVIYGISRLEIKLDGVFTAQKCLHWPRRTDNRISWGWVSESHLTSVNEPLSAPPPFEFLFQVINLPKTVSRLPYSILLTFILKFQSFLSNLTPHSTTHKFVDPSK